MQANLEQARVFDGILSREEAAERISQARAQGFASAATHYPPSYRNNARLVVDDVALAGWLFARLRPRLPAVIRDSEGARWELCGLNSRFRYCCYQAGQKFAIHRDGAHFESANQRSFLTAMIYLNDASEFDGGETRFYADRDARKEPVLRILPRCGAAAVFSQSLWHDGAAVVDGQKYIMRTDVMYRRSVAVAEDAHRGYIWALSSLEGGLVASAGRDKSVRIWKGSECREHLQGHQLSVTSLGGNGVDKLWSGGRDGELRWWRRDGKSWLCEHKVRAHEGVVVSLTDAHHDRFASGGADGTVCTWSLNGKLQSRWRRHESWVWALAWGEDGRLYSASEDGTIAGPDRLVGSGAPMRALVRAEDSFYAGDARGVISRWREDLTCLERWHAHTGAVTSLLALPGSLLASASEDDTVRLWDLKTQQCLQTWQHDDFVRCLAQGSDGQLWSGGYDGRLRALQGTRAQRRPVVEATSEGSHCLRAH